MELISVIIDRFEGEYAIVEMPDLTFINVPRVLFPDSFEGDVISIFRNENERHVREARIKKLADELFID